MHIYIVIRVRVCYVHDHHTEEGHTFRLPSIRNTHLSIAARRVAVAGITSQPGMVSLVLWDFDTQKTSIVDVSKDTCLNSVLLHPHEDAFLLFGGKQTPAAAAGRGLYPEAVDYVKYSVDGAMISAQELWVNGGWTQENWHWGIYPSGAEGLSTCYYETHLISDRATPDSQLVYEDRYISYDMHSDVLLVDKLTRPIPATCKMSTLPEWPALLRQNVRWKDVVYMAGRNGWRQEPLFIRKFNDMTSARETEMSEIDHSVANPRTRLVRFVRGYKDNENSGFWILCDDRFFILIGYYQIQVWCFEKDLVMADEEPGYRKERTRRAEIRATERRRDAKEK